MIPFREHQRKGQRNRKSYQGTIPLPNTKGFRSLFCKIHEKLLQVLALSSVCGLHDSIYCFGLSIMIITANTDLESITIFSLV